MLEARKATAMTTCPSLSAKPNGVNIVSKARYCCRIHLALACRAEVGERCHRLMSEIIGFTTGAFDLFHAGHLNLLKAASERCDRLIVGVATDEFAAQRKGIWPVVPFAERCEIVRNIKGVEAVFPHFRIDDVEDWKKHKFKRMFKGSDWKGHPRWTALRRLDVELVFLPYTEHISTTLRRESLNGASQHTSSTQPNILLDQTLCDLTSLQGDLSLEGEHGS